MHPARSWGEAVRLVYLELWLRTHEAMRRSLASLSHHFVFQLEWLTSHPEESVPRLSAFVGLDLRYAATPATGRPPRSPAPSPPTSPPPPTPAPSAPPPPHEGRRRANLDRREAGKSRHTLLALHTGTSPKAVAKVREINATTGAPAARCIADLVPRLRVFGYSLDELDPNLPSFFVQGRRPLWEQHLSHTVHGRAS